MKKRRVFLILFTLFIAAIAAGFFDFPQYGNVLLSKIPGKLRIPDRPYSLGLDLQGGVQLTYSADLSKLSPGDYDSAMQSLQDVIERRINLFGVKEPVVQTEGSGGNRKLSVEMAGIHDPAQAIQLIGQTPYLEFKEPKSNFDQINQDNQKIAQAGKGNYEDPFQDTPLTGQYLKKADVIFSSTTNEPAVSLQFNSEGAKLFEQITGRNIGKPLAIFLDYQLIEAPIVNSAISGGNAQITGKFTVKEAQTIVKNLNAGALPAPITLISQQSVGATLGNVSLTQSLKAGILGFLGVIAFMILFYRLPGLLASLALLLYAVFILALFKLIPVTLTLSGIAGFILSVGMAVDVNVLIFSRMREELKGGRSFEASVEEGFRRAWPSIRDGHLTILFVSLILFWFGSSFVQGFALTLALGVLMSLFTGIIVTRNLLRVFSKTLFERIKWLWE